ncbi:MAG: hypothetical protein OHK0046_08760 [Anaerolineae bacterium]
MRTLLSARNLSFVVLVFAIGVSGYLSYLKVSNVQPVCVEGGQFDCGVVLNSAYSELGGIPIAWLGLATNLIVLTLLVLEPRVEFLRYNGVALVFGIVLFAFLFSVYLVYVQAAIIRAFCPWCLTHEALITVLFGLSIWRLREWFGGEDDLELQAQQVGD